MPCNSVTFRPVMAISPARARLPAETGVENPAEGLFDVAPIDERIPPIVLAVFWPALVNRIQQ